MPHGGTILISTKVSHLREDPELAAGRYVELTVSDDGPGMSSEVQARAFEPFFTTKGPGKGTGLGLSMVYGVAQQSGGTARIRSEAGAGTSVSLFLKTVEETAEEEEATAQELAITPPSNRTGRILVVDDDPDVRTFLVASLSAEGHDIVEAEEGRRAVELLEANCFDLLLVDFAMPGISGAEVAEAALRIRPEQQILFVTGYSESAAIERAAPQATVLRKPFSSETLNGIVQRHLALSARGA